MCALEIEISTVIIDIYFLTYIINFLLSIKDCEAQKGELQEELASRETMNTPAVTATQTGKEKYCNFNQNDELLINISRYRYAHFRCCISRPFRTASMP